MTDNSGSSDKRFVYQDQLQPNISAEELQRTLDVTSDELQRLGIEGRVQVTPNEGYSIEFTNEADYLIISNMMEHANPKYETASHVQHFKNCEPEFERSWVNAAGRTLSEAGMAFQHDYHPGHSVKFSFPTILGRTMFQKLIETGFFDREAQLSVDHPEEPAAGTSQPETPGF
ncbi:MAG: hypothetical protein AAFY08_16115 [Planctomycetota bacterium]